jgi:hypothetical protein
LGTGDWGLGTEKRGEERRGERRDGNGSNETSRQTTYELIRARLVYLYAGAYDSHQRYFLLVWYSTLYFVAPHVEPGDRSFNSAARPILAYDGRQNIEFAAEGGRCKMQMAVDGIPFWILANGKSVVTG